MKKFLFILIIFLISLPAYSQQGTIATYVIDAEKNAFNHNNLGVIAVEEHDYYAAIQEFKMAISLNPKTQATSVYFNNLGKVYMQIGYPKLALDCFLNAITQYNLNFDYYLNLVSCYDTLGETQKQLNIYKSKNSNPFDRIMLGLLYEKIGNNKKAIIVLDEFVMTEPNLLITPAVKLHIQKIVDKIQ